MGQNFQSSCSLNCWDNCGFSVTVEDHKVTKVEGDVTHPITKGKICGRGRMLETRTNAKDRILYPLKKINGKFERIPWQQALNEIAFKMNQVKKEFGTSALFHSHDYANNGLLKNLDKRFFNCYGGVTELIGSLCWGAGIEAQYSDFGNSYSHSPDDIRHSRTVVIWGRNVSRTNIHLFQKLQEVKKAGTKIIVIDPMLNGTAKLANTFISIKPGMDGILALGIMKEILKNGLEDRLFIDQHSIGFSNVKALLETLSMDEVLKQTNLSKQQLDELVEAYTNGPTATYLGLGMQRYTNGGNTIRAIDALIAMSGNVGIPGGGANYGNLAVGQSFNTEALALSARKEKSRIFTRMEQANQILHAKNPEIKMLFVTSGNPLSQVPDTTLVTKAFSSIETKVVIEQFMTDTAQLADYVLPCTTVFEDEDVYYSSMYHHYVNYGPALVPAPGEAKSDLWIWTELANRLGFGDDFNFTIDEFLKMGLGDLEKKGITLERIKREKHVALPVQDVPWHDKKFQTPSGKYEFTSERLKEKGLFDSIQISYPFESEYSNPELAKEYPYTLLSIHPGRSNHSQHYHLIEKIQSVTVEISPDIAEENGIQTGNQVKVYNNRGQILGRAKVAYGLHSKTINIDEGGWSKFGGSVNLLTPDRPSDNQMGSTLFDCLVALEKVN